MDEMKCEWSGVKNVARTSIPFIKLDRIKVILYKYLYNRWIWVQILVQISKWATAGARQLFYRFGLAGAGNKNQDELHVQPWHLYGFLSTLKRKCWWWWFQSISHGYPICLYSWIKSYLPPKKLVAVQRESGHLSLSSITPAKMLASFVCFLKSDNNS